MDHPPLALRLAAALAHATFAASVLLPALVTVRCAVGADGADRRRARSWLRYWCVAGPLLALEASALGRFIYGALTLTGGNERVLGLAVIRFLLAERLATTNLCDDLYEALEGFLAPREAKIRRGLDSLSDASMQAGKRAGAVALAVHSVARMSSLRTRKAARESTSTEDIRKLAADARRAVAAARPKEKEEVTLPRLPITKRGRKATSKVRAALRMNAANVGRATFVASRSR